MKRRAFITGLGGAVAWPLVVRGQSASRVPRIGWLVTGSPEAYRFSLAAFRDGLQALGYVEGHNILIEYRWAEGNLARIPELAKDLVDRNVDIILAGGSVGVQAAKNATSLIPIVGAGSGDFVEVGLVTNLARPGGNVTGFATNAPESAAKRLQIIKELLPKSKYVAVLWNPTNAFAQLEWKAATKSASTLDLALSPYEASTIKELENKLAAIPQSGTDMLIVLNDPFMFALRKTIVASALQRHFAGIYGFREYTDDGGLVSYGPSISDTYRRAAIYVDKIIKGAKPGDLPIVLPTKFELVINLKTAKALGLEIPATLLARADEVIE